METIVKINQKLVKRKILELAKTKKELDVEKNKNASVIINALKPKLDTDILTLTMIKEEYKISEKTIYRKRSKGLKYSQEGSRGFVYIVRKDLEDFLKKNKYDK
jgi:hypothetical protein